MDPIGKVNFYPNGGRFQPGCTWDITGLCSHQRAYQYFAETVYSPKPFYGFHCESLNEVKNGNCTVQKTALFGGEPGAREQ